MNVPKKKPLAANQLGELEADVMNVLWDIDEGSVQDVLTRLQRRKALAYTTVMTVLGRLVDKGFLERQKDGRAYLYRPLVSRESMAESALESVVDRFFDGVSARAVAQLLGRRQRLDEDELARLESEVQRARKGKGRR